MLRFFLLIISFFFNVSFVSAADAPAKDKKEDKRSFQVLVTAPPHKFFVNKIAGDTVEVIFLVPPGLSFHTYEPSPRQMLQASSADIWFLIGENFEKQAVKAFRSNGSNMLLVNMQQGLDLISDEEHGHCCNHHHPHKVDKGSEKAFEDASLDIRYCVDLHFWLSPKLAKRQAETIAAALSSQYPENKELYARNLASFIQELEKLDQEIAELMAKKKSPYILVGHPAYSYFCRDYNLIQLSIEFEGKDPTPYQLTTLLKDAKEKHITTIFVQKQYGSKGAKLVAKEIGAKLVTLDPYSPDYLNSMREIAKRFSES